MLLAIPDGERLRPADPAGTMSGQAHRQGGRTLRSKATRLPTSRDEAVAATQTVCVVGLGYVGLPMAAVLASRGFNVTGVDVDPKVRAELLDGPSGSHEAGLDFLLREAVEAGRFAASASPAAADVYVIAVPTPLSDEREGAADLSYVREAARSLAPSLEPGNLVVLESTVPPGTTEQVLVPELERSGLRAGRDLLVAHVPERVLPGNVLAELIHNPRVIGGIDRESAEAAGRLYASFVEGEIILADARTAEMVKLMENTYRDVNIALANEFALLAQELGVDVWQAIAIANQHPRVEILRPGPGVGGHCVPVDPWFLARASSYPAPLIRAARAVNDAMPERIADLLEELLADVEEPAVALLGLAYKSDTDDTRNSPALAVAQKLRARRWDVRLFDPHVQQATEPGPTAASLLEAAAGADCLVLMTDHRAFEALDPRHLRSVVRRALALDTRGVLDEAAWRAAGFEVRRLGAPASSSNPTPPK